MTIDVADVQGNVLRPYGKAFTAACHLAVQIGDPGRARAFLGTVADSVTVAGWERKPDDCLNVGITYAGLAALGVPDGVLGEFPDAFRAGAAARAAAEPELGDVDASDPRRWEVGGPWNPVVHLLVTVHARRARALDAAVARLRAALADHALGVVWTRDAALLPQRGQVHFGYRDGIAQPRVKGLDLGLPPDDQPEMPPGDLLLGCDHENSFGGNYAGDLPHALCDNASYGAFRVMRQDVAGFYDVLERWAAGAGLDRELVAAKLMGRWRSGTPLVLSPHEDERLPAERLNRFGYADDGDGERCPIGSHIRRLNPRDARVMGLPHAHRLMRRNMPYGPVYDPEHPTDHERGLVGSFLCGDLETQWEFVQRMWVNGDLATHGVRGTREPVTGAQPPEGGTLDIGSTRLEGLPTLVDTRGGLHCFIPGIGGLRHLAAGAPA